MYFVTDVGIQYAFFRRILAMNPMIILRMSPPALLLALVFAGCSREAAEAGKSSAGTETSAVAVQALQVQPEKIDRTVELVGTLEGEHEVTISSEVAARVTAIRADLGDRVQQGSPVVELDPTEYRLSVARQRSALLQVSAQLGVMKEGDPVPAASETSIVRRAQADLADARSTFERTKALLAKGVAAQALYDTAEARYQAVQANYTSAQEQVRNLLAQADNLRTQLALAEKKLADCTIRAPFTGTVRTRLVEVGQYVKDQTAVMSIASVDPLKLRASVPERWFPHVAPGAQLNLTVEAYADRFPGRVTRVGGAVDPQSRTFNIEARIDNSRGRLRPGLFARAVLVTSKIDSVLRVPAVAVISYYGVQKIYAIQDGLIVEKVVKLGDRSGDVIEVTDGLAAGTWIAVSELTRIRQGSRVQVRREG